MPDTLTPTKDVQAQLPTAETPLSVAALHYATLGWHIFPLRPAAKVPLVSGGFHSATNDLNNARGWWRQIPQANIGLAPSPSGLVIFDIDSEAAEQIAIALGLLDVQTLTARTGRRDFSGRHLYFQRPDLAQIGNLRLALRGNQLFRVDGKTAGLEVKADAGYVVAPPSVHPSGSTYAFEDPGLPPSVLPPRALVAIESALKPRTVALMSSDGPISEVPGPVGPRPSAFPGFGSSPREPGISLSDAEGWLDALAPERCEDYHGWVGVLMALHHQFTGTPDEADARELAVRWSQQSGKYQKGDVEEKWRSFAATETKAEITIRSLRRWAAEDTKQRQGYPVIDCTIASETTLTVPTWRAIAKRNEAEPHTYWSNGGLAALRPRADATLYVAPFTNETLSQHLAEKVADFERRNRVGILTPCYPPLGLVKQLLANPAPPVNLPRLKRVVPVPIFASNGELITTPGYHEASQTVYAPPPWLRELRSVSPRPSADEVQAAVRTFDKHVGKNFPFDEDDGASRAHALCLALQGFVMDVIGQMAPLYDRSGTTAHREGTLD